jgi:tRNA (mo5U34)-methyltransferase
MDGSTPMLKRDLATQVAEMKWYHTFDLPGGVTTAGMFDHRKFVTKLPLPNSLAGKRCLDAAAADGFFGFEMARRGAAEVVSVDLPDPDAQDFAGVPRQRTWAIGPGRANQCFALVREATGLDVRRVDGSIYDLGKMDLGTFDVVFLGNILLHLRDPIGALQAVRTVTGGELLSVEPVSLPQTILRPFTPTGQFSLGDANTFWTPNLRGHRALVTAGGFDLIDSGGPILQPMGGLLRMRPSRAHLPRNLHEVVYWSFTRPFGKATGWVRARPTR